MPSCSSLFQTEYIYINLQGYTITYALSPKIKELQAIHSFSDYEKVEVMSLS